MPGGDTEGYARLAGWELPPEWRRRLLDAATSKEKLASFRRELLAEIAGGAEGEEDE